MDFFFPILSFSNNNFNDNFLLAVVAVAVPVRIQQKMGRPAAVAVVSSLSAANR